MVAAADGAKFPSAGSFNATVWPAGTQATTTNAEIVRVTAISTDTFTITRAQESTSARTIIVGDQIAATITKKTITDLEYQSPNVYLTTQDETLPANAQLLFDDYLELAASFVYELASGGVLVIGEGGTPVYATGQEIGYAQITSSANITDTSESTATPLISSGPLWFDGTPVIAEFFAQQVATDTAGTGDVVNVTLFEGLTEIGRLGTIKTIATAARSLNQMLCRYRFTPTTGYHAYAICAFATSTTGTPVITAGAGGTAAPVPAYLRFTKV